MDLSQYLNATILIPAAAFLAVATVVYLLYDRFSGANGRTEQRLDEFRDPRKRAEKAARAFSPRAAIKNAISTAAPLGQMIQPKKEAEQSKLRLRLAHAGFRNEMAPQILLTIKAIGLFLGLLFGGGLALMGGFDKFALLKLVGSVGAGFFGPDIVLRLLGARRQKGIFLSMPDALDLLVVCVEAGQGLDQAMRKVAEEMKRSYPLISHEFGLCNMQMQMGRSRSEVMHELGERNGVEDLRTLSAIIIQADKFGSSIAQALRVQSDAMRTRRRQIAEEKAAKTAVKLIFPLVLFIFPGIFVVLVGPAGITMVREMFPAMQAAQAADPPANS